MNIGILTVYDSSNFGSFLQAYAMMTHLKKMGHNVNFIKWNKKNQIVHDILKRAIITRRVSIRNVYNAIDKIKYYKSDIGLLPVIDQGGQLDLIIIGSDTLWDIRRKYFSNPMFYGKIDENVPCISYAVSCAESKEADFIKKMYLTNNIRNLDKILVRDKHTQNVIKDVLDLQSDIVCDPTILVNDVFWNNEEKEDVKRAILVYTYTMPKNVSEIIKKYAAEHKLKLISIGLFQPWCDEHINCSALDFPAYLKSAKLVVTNTFHGTLFSLLTGAHVVSFVNGNKLKELLESLYANSISMDLDCTYEKFCDKVNQNIDYGSINERVHEIQNKSEILIKQIISKYADNTGE